MKLGTLKRIIREAVKADLNHMTSYEPAPRDQWIGPPPGAVGSPEAKSVLKARADKSIANYHLWIAGLSYEKEQTRREWNEVKNNPRVDKEKWLEDKELQLLQYAQKKIEYLEGMPGGSRYDSEAEADINYFINQVTGLTVAKIESADWLKINDTRREGR
jgi:hypothetical protein